MAADKKKVASKVNSKSGIGTVTLLIFVTLAGVISYVAYYVLPFYYYYYDLLGQFEQVIKVAQFETDEEIRKKLMYHINKYQIPCNPEDLRIERIDDTMVISLQYTEVFKIPWGDKEYEVRRFDFDATVSGHFR